MSLFELPVSRGARLARVVAVLLLDLVLAGAGVAMILSYLDDRAEAAQRGEAVAMPTEPATAEADVEVLEPDPVDAEEVKREPTKRASQLDARGKRAPAGAAPSGRDGAAGASKSDTERDAEDDAPAKDREPPAGAGAGEPDDPAGDIDMGTPATGGGAAGEPGAEDDSDGTLEPEPDEATRVQFSAARVRRVVDRHAVQLQKCYQRATKTASLSEPLEGRVDVQFVIMPDGHASNVRTVSNNTGSDQLAACVAGLIEGWQFPSPGAEEIAFVWPFLFRAP